jgi:hypothetical protein
VSLSNRPNPAGFLLSALRFPLLENALRPTARVSMSDAMHALDPQTIAERVRDGMFPADAASHGLGLSFVAVGPGSAKMTMLVRADMLNGIKLAQGGFITALADAAFAYACNSYNEQAVATLSRCSSAATPIKQSSCRKLRRSLREVAAHFELTAGRPTPPVSPYAFSRHQ